LSRRYRALQTTYSDHMYGLAVSESWRVLCLAHRGDFNARWLLAHEGTCSAFGVVCNACLCLRSSLMRCQLLVYPFSHSSHPMIVPPSRDDSARCQRHSATFLCRQPINFPRFTLSSGSQDHSSRSPIKAARTDGKTADLIGLHSIPPTSPSPPHNTPTPLNITMQFSAIFAILAVASTALASPSVGPVAARAIEKRASCSIPVYGEALCLAHCLKDSYCDSYCTSK
jgi:hypothetical protein